MQRRHALLLAAATLAGAPFARAQTTRPLSIDVWKDPNCGCCNDWIAILEKDGFRVNRHDTGNNAIRQRLGLAQKYASCHTAVIEGYAIEGHVPAADIRRLLKERPQAIGLAVPGMPVGSPGMDGPEYGGRQDPHDVLLVLKDGSSKVYTSYFRKSA